MRESADGSKESSFRNEQKVLQRNDIRYKLLVDNIKDYAIFLLDTKGFVKTWNIGAEKITGYSKEDIIDQHFSRFYTDEANAVNHPAYELKVAKEQGRFEEEGWRIRKDGTRFWVNVIITSIYNKNELVGFSKVTRDLTERKSLEEKLLKKNEELRESEERARLLISGVKDYAIFLLSPEGKILSWNEGAERIKGYKTEEIVGSHFSVFYTPEAISANYPHFELNKALIDGRFEDEGWRVKKDGTRFWANVVITAIFNTKNQHIGFTKITRDLTEHIKNEELMRKNQELHKVNTDLDNFVYTASHDLKSPIANLEGFLSLMENKIGPTVDESGRQIISLMGHSIQKLRDTIESLVEVTKAQKNLEDEVAAVSFHEVLGDVKEEIRTMITESEADIEEVFDVETVTFARVSLRSIMYNLLSNAIKYRSPDRPLKIRISSYEDGGKTILSIKDNGLGLTKTQESKLFSMFKRFHSHVEGTGIGLYIVKRTIENYNGKIEVNSTLGEGTEFKLFFSV